MNELLIASLVILGTLVVIAVLAGTAVVLADRDYERLRRRRARGVDRPREDEP